MGSGHLPPDVVDAIRQSLKVAAIQDAPDTQGNVIVCFCKIEN